ncbi:hypothetical protein SNE26_09295 [Mucilaginibacter sp. cycad4]|uniref:hypothetical protein n=1 Tax=Mucilaginibacter sp. cycad4 TaxID=3342096 RepID=UPI002AAA7A84|nr:hypothetical protein [Mucilaginibacter gossypii]WPV01968.1 hypothetical protein SNE26_09295 [Mucilaginibacter gossypii]
MKRHILLYLLLSIAYFASGQTTDQNVPQLGKDPIKKVMAAMTLEEKTKLVTGMGLGAFGHEPVAGRTEVKVTGAAGANLIPSHLR